ncbi:MAG: hypothetical protein KatS3mg057_2080 [Herpetosiphonaceae bacterium]|nr:MAG: hypothetical protein KatS3mg057_2080 [Herpetosiphonaceae bacterium]
MAASGVIVRSMLHVTAALIRGFLLRCPHCKTGHMFRTMFEMYPVCPDCGVVFERDPGEITGGMGINISVTMFVFFVGFILMNALTSISLVVQLLIWIPFMIVFPILFYPCSRGLWVSILYLTGNVYRE